MFIVYLVAWKRRDYHDGPSVHPAQIEMGPEKEAVHCGSTIGTSSAPMLSCASYPRSESPICGYPRMT